MRCAKDVVFVLGMGRTGSSLLARVLGLAGAAFPGPLLPANSGNERGYWEPIEVLKINEAFLEETGSSWFDSRIGPTSEAIEPTAGEKLKERVGRFFQARNETLLVIKEPRIAAIPGPWLEGAEKAGYAVSVVVPVRHPTEVIASLIRRDGISPELGAALWLKYNLSAEHASRPFPRVFVEYSRFLTNWREEVARIRTSLAISLRPADSSEADAFVTSDLRHHVCDAAPAELFGGSWINDVYAALSAAASGETIDADTMDHIRLDCIPYLNRSRAAAGEPAPTAVAGKDGSHG